MVSPVESWWAGLYARVFDKLRLTGLLHLEEDPSFLRMTKI